MPKLTVEKLAGPLELAHLVDAKLGFPHALGDVLVVPGPLAAGHVQVGRAAAAAEGLGHVALHGTVEADGAEAIVGLEPRVPQLGLGRRGRLAVEQDGRGDVAGPLRPEAARFRVEDLRDIGGQGQARRLRIVAHDARVQPLTGLVAGLDHRPR